MCVPEWVNANDLKQIDESCGNVEAIDFSTTREAIDATRLGTQLELNGHFAFPLVLDKCQRLLEGVKRVSVNYGNGCKLETIGLQSFPEGLPRLLKLATRLKVLQVCCRYRNWRWVIGGGFDEIPQRAETAQDLCRAIVENVGQHLQRLSIARAPFIIPNLYDFTLGLETLPNLKTIQVPVHHDLQWYQRGYFEGMRDSPGSHPMMAPWQYLNALRRVEERGRFAIRNSDSADGWQSNPRAFFPSSRVNDAVDPEFDMTQYASPSYRKIGWTPVWNWLKFFRLHCPRGPPYPLSWSLYWELTGARQLFKALHQAGAYVSVSFNANYTGGALFAQSRDVQRERCPKDAAFLFGDDEDGRNQIVSNEKNQLPVSAFVGFNSFEDESDTIETPATRLRTNRRHIARDLAFEQVWQCKPPMVPGHPEAFIPCTEAHLEPNPPFCSWSDM